MAINNLEVLVSRLNNRELWDPKCFRPNYLVFDIETTGVNFTSNRINQFGVLLVKDGIGSVNSAIAKYINTPYSPVVWSAIYAGLDSRSRQFLTLLRKEGCNLDEVKKAIDDNDGSCQGVECIPESIRQLREDDGSLRFQTAVDKTKISSKTCKEKGLEREQALLQFKSIIERAASRRFPLVGHNHLGFDIPFMDTELRMFCGCKLEYDPELILDLGLIEKSVEIKSPIKKNESAASFYARIANRRSRAKWDLDNHCFFKYKLARFGVDPTKEHLSAGYDCFVSHCLMRAMLGVSV